MRARRPALGLIAAGALALACAVERAEAQGSRVEQTEETLVLRLGVPIAEVLESLQAAVQQHNYVLTRTNNLDEALRARAASLDTGFGFEHYKVVSYCNLSLADEALRVEPTLGALMPCRMAVYVPAGSREVVIVTIRPTFLMRSFRSPAVQRLAHQVEADTLAILRMVAGE